MKSLFRRLAFIIVIASILLSACGGSVDGPNDINWTTNSGESDRLFGDIYSGNDLTLDITSDDSLSEDSKFLVESFDQCDLENQQMKTCFGSEEMGYIKLPDGSYKVFFDGVCYIVDGESDLFSAVDTTMKEVSEKLEEIEDSAGRLGWRLVGVGFGLTVAIIGCSTVVLCIAGVGGAVVSGVFLYKDIVKTIDGLE